jgi:cytoskeletal protein CcmA (bactofilin family)
MIEQGAVFEGTCKMTQAKAAAKEPARIERKDNIIDVTKPAVKPETTTPAKPIVSAVAN